MRAIQPSGDRDAPRGLVVAIRGVARADPEDLVSCQHASETDAGGTPRRCIYYDAVTEQHLARQAVRNGEWIRDSQTVANITGEASAWRLEDDAGRAVNLHRASAFGERSDAAKAGDWSLVVVHDSFQPASSGVAAGFLTNLVDMNMGIHVLGTRHRERIIPPGTALTAVGEVTLGRGGDGAGVELRLRKPENRSEGGSGSRGNRAGRTEAFTVTQRTFEEYVAGFGAWSRAFAVAGSALVVVGVGLAATRLVVARATRRRERRFRRRLAEAEAARAARGGAEDGAEGGAEEGAEKLAPGETCVVCLYSRAVACYRECGHLVCCEVCAARMDRCPLCRRKSAWMKVYRAGG